MSDEAGRLKQITELQDLLSAANAEVSKWAADFKKLAHECGGTELERQRLEAEIVALRDELKRNSR